MAISFTDVAHALDEVVEMEEGVRSERLCVALARRKYPGLIATESKKDSGHDAIYAGDSIAGLGVPGISVSITNTLSKVKIDARAIRDSGVKIDTLVFYTPKKVSNTKAQEWTRAIFSEFGHMLIVVPREDIIHSLLEPENAFIAEQYLGIEVDGTQDLNRVIPDARRAASQITDQWMTALQVANDQLITLFSHKLDVTGDRVGQIVDMYALKVRLTNSDRVLLFGQAGAGKSTTLTMISASLVNEGTDSIPLLVSIPEFLDSHKPILDYVADQPSFRTSGICGADLALLADRGNIVFLLNGWNEVSGADMERASRALHKLAREYPSAGVLATSRPQKIDPFGGGSIRFELAEVSDAQRESYVQYSLPKKWSDFLQHVEGSAPLDSLSRSPFILKQLVTLYVANDTLPKTRAEVLESIMVSTESLPEHAPALEVEPILGFSQKYLAALAAAMISRGRISLAHADACKVVSDVSASLVVSSLRASAPEPLSVLKVMSAHHLLEEIAYPEPAFRFIHQQFQESFGAAALLVRAASILGDDEQIALFQSEVINVPVWEESLLLFAEKLGVQGGEEAAAIGRVLVEWAVKVDPITAAKLCGVLGQIVEIALTDALEPVLRRWYESSSSAHRACAVVAMVASGSDRFADIIWCLLEDESRDVRAMAFDTASSIELSVLGDDWRARIEAWPSKQRIEFVAAIGYSGSQDGIDLASYFAVNDPDVDVRLRSFDVLWFEGARAKLFDTLEAVDDETFRRFVHQDRLPESLPHGLADRQSKALATLISDSGDAKSRIRLAIRALRLGDVIHLGQLKFDLNQTDMSGLDSLSERELYEIVPEVSAHDKPWAVQWVQSRVLREELQLVEWASLARLSDSSVYDPLLDELSNLDSPDSRVRRDNELLVAVIDSGQIEKVMSFFVIAHSKLEQAPRPKSENLKNAYFRIRDLLRALPLPVLAEAVSQRIAKADEDREILGLLDLLGPSQPADLEDGSVRVEMDPDALGRLRQRLRELIRIVESAEDSSGELIRLLGCAIGRFGDKQDIQLIEHLIGIDVDRRARGSNMGIHNWLIGALLRLAGDDCENFLLELLLEPEYEAEAARALYQLVRIPPEKSSMFPGGVQSYKAAAEQRMVPNRRFVSEIKRNLYADAVKKNLLDLITATVDSSPYSVGKLKALASILSLFNREDDVQLILEQLSLEGKWDAWVVLDTVERLVFSGIILKSEDVKKALDPVVKRIVDGDEWYQPDDQSLLLMKCVTILLFSDDPVKGTELLSSLYPSKVRQYHLYDVVDIAGYSQSEEAASWLMSLFVDSSLDSRLFARILVALVNIGGKSYQDVFSALLGLGEAAPIRIEMSRETIEPFARVVADKISADSALMQRLIEKCSEELQPQQLAILTSVINMAKDPSLDIAALLTIRDGQQIPWSVHNVIKRALFEEVPVPGRQGAFNVYPVENTKVRARLLEMVYKDELRKDSAYELLGEIDKWRLESGKPDFESRHPSMSSGYSWPIVETGLG